MSQSDMPFSTFRSLTVRQYPPGGNTAGETNKILAGGRFAGRQPARVLDVLTMREIQVIFGVARGRSNAEIGEDLGITELTVKTHLQRITRKTKVQNRAQMVTWGYRHGLLQRLRTYPLTVAWPIKLTNRETEMLHWIIRGLTNEEIASTVFLSRATVKYHVKALFRKTGAKDRAHVITLAWQHYLVPRESWEEERGTGK